MAETDQRLARLKVLTGETDNELLSVLLSAAESRVRTRLYPFDPYASEIPAVYQSTVLEIATYLYNRRGSEGELSHDEGDIKRTYAGASVPEEMLRGVVPFCGVP